MVSPTILHIHGSEDMTNRRKLEKSTTFKYESNFLQEENRLCKDRYFVKISIKSVSTKEKVRAKAQWKVKIKVVCEYKLK